MHDVAKFSQSLEDGNGGHFHAYYLSISLEVVVVIAKKVAFLNYKSCCFREETNKGIKFLHGLR